MNDYFPRFTQEIKLKSFYNIVSGAKRFEKINITDGYYFDSGTECLTFFLESMHLPSTTVVGVPLYACSSVFQSIYSAGYKIKFLDIVVDNEGYRFADDAFAKIDVLLFIHYFGVYYHGLDIIKKNSPHLIIIEDCTHISPTQYLRNPNTDFVCFSFNFHKPISCGIGGLGIINNVKWRANIDAEYNKLSCATVKQNIVKLLKIFIKNLAFNPYLYKYIYALAEKRRIKMKSEINPQNIIVPRKVSLLAKILLGNQWNDLHQTNCKRYFEISRRYRLDIHQTALVEICYFPVFLRDLQTRELVRKELSEKGIDAYVLWENCRYNAVFFGNLIGDFFRSDVFLQTALFLPARVFEESNIFADVNDIINRYDRQPQINNH